LKPGKSWLDCYQKRETQGNGLRLSLKEFFQNGFTGGMRLAPYTYDKKAN